MSVLLLILGLVLFVCLVIVHEWGHMIVARRNGVEVEEFGIGFPPAARRKKLKSGMVLSLNWLPLGGFVKLKGEHDADREKGSYGRANIWAKSRIMMAGVGMNLLTAFLILTFLAAVGMPKLIDNQFTINKDTKISRNQVLIGYVESDSPAEKAGLKVEDRLLAFMHDGQTFTVQSADTLPNITKQFPGQTVTVRYMRSGEEKSVDVKLRGTEEVEDSQKSDNPKGYLGISPTEYTLRRSTWSAPIVALGLMWQFTVATLAGLWHAISALFSGHTAEAGAQVSGPVGIFVILKNGSLLGYQFVLMIIAVISLTLAIMNALPIPALDGGRLFVTWVYKLMHKPLTQRAEEWIHGTGFALLMALFVLITVVDIRRFT